MTTPPSALPRSSLYRVEAVVLRHRDLGEADRLLTLYSREHGKLRATVRAARKITSRLGGHVEPLTHTSLVLVRGRTLDSVTQAQALETFSGLRNDLLTTARGLHAVALVDLFTEEQEPQPALFDLLLEALRRLDQAQPGDLVLRAFEVRLLEEVGYRPLLDRCASCGRPADPSGEMAFAAAWGGLLCAACRSGQEGAERPVSAEALRALLLLQRRGLAAVQDLSLEEAAAREVEALLRWYLTYLLERPLETAVFLDELRGL